MPMTQLNGESANETFSRTRQTAISKRSNALQSVPRSSSETGSTYELDWVGRDNNILVGYESKVGRKVPSTGQLEGELQKLEANSARRIVHLFAVTDHTRPPSTIEKTDADWLSWYQVAEHVLDIDTDDKSIQMLQAMFRDKDYDGFTGFTEFQHENFWLTLQDAKFVELAINVERYLDNIQVYTDGLMVISEVHLEFMSGTFGFSTGIH
jgi:hypothetical protein